MAPEANTLSNLSYKIAQANSNFSVKSIKSDANNLIRNKFLLSPLI